MRERRAPARDITDKLARMGVLIGIDDVAFHHDVSIRPAIITGVICWVDIRTPGGAHTVPILSAFNGHFQSKSRLPRRTLSCRRCRGCTGAR
eukprot:2863890-Pyramimonas_sp.AAC.1